MSQYTQLDSHKVREGWLWKKGVYNTKHKRRYFVLFDDRTVDYYQSKEDADKGRNKSKGTILLTQIKRVELVLYEGDQHHQNLLPPSLQSSLQRTAFNGRAAVSHSKANEHPQSQLRHQKRSISSITQSGFEEELPFLSHAGLPSVSEQDESLADPQFSRSQSRARLSDVRSIDTEHEAKIDMNDATNVDLNGWTMNGGSVISSVRPPADYAELQRTAQKFENERKEFTKSLLDLSKLTLSAVASPLPRPPTPNLAKNKKRAHSSFAYEQQSHGKNAPFISASTTSPIPSHGSPTPSPGPSPQKLKLRRSPSCPSLDRPNAMIKKKLPLKPSASSFQLLTAQTHVQQVHKSSADSTLSDVVECVLTDADADESPEESVSYMSKSVIASDIRKHHLKNNRKTSGSTMSVTSVRSTSTMDSLDDACALTPRDEYEAFTAILKDTKLGLRSDRRYSFALISKARDYLLATESSEQLKDWIVIFNKLCQGAPIFDGYFNNHKNRFFVLYQNKVLNCYKSQENLESIQDIDLRHIFYLFFNQRENKLQIAIPNAGQAENKLTLIAPNASIARQWYHKFLSMFDKRSILKKIYDSAVQNIFLSHNEKNMASCYVAMYKEYMVIFRNEEQYLSMAKMVFFNKRIFRDYVRKEQCTIIPINANVHVRKASKNHGKHSFVVSNGDRKWYFTVASKAILEAWLSRLKPFTQSGDRSKHSHAQHHHKQHRIPVTVHESNGSRGDVQIASSLRTSHPQSDAHAKVSNNSPERPSLNLDHKSSDSVKSVESVSGDSATNSSL